jgi:S-adenosylmethionine decarboxylase
MSVSRPLSFGQQILIRKQLKQYQAENNNSLFSQLVRENLLSAIYTIRDRRTEIGMNQSQFLGQHMVLEFMLDVRTAPQSCRILSAQNPREDVQDIILNAAKAARATIIKSASSQPDAMKNCSAIVVIQESHLTIHVRHCPNGKIYIGVDNYTCGVIDIESAIRYILNALEHAVLYDRLPFKRGIRDEDGSFVPGVAVPDAASRAYHFFQPQPLPSALGRQALVDCYGCDPFAINVGEYILDKFRQAIINRGGDPECCDTHQFNGQGMTTTVLGNGYHLSVHTWPEYKFASFDLLTFDEKLDPALILQDIIPYFGAQKINCQYFPRGAYDVKSGLLTPVFEKFLPIEAKQESKAFTI